MKNAFAVFVAIVLTVFVGFASLRSARAFPVTPPTPNPCTSVGQSGCQPVWSARPASPTPTPITLTPNSNQFAGPTSTPATATIAEGSYSGPWTATAPPGGLVTVGVSTNTLTVTPANNGSGSGTVAVAHGANIGYYSFGITATPPPTPTPTPTPSPTPTPPGPLSINPKTGNFIGATAAPQTFSILDPNYSGAFTVSPSPVGIVSAGVSGNVITVTPITLGAATITVGDGTQTTPLPITVVTPTPSPTPSPTPVVTPTALTFLGPGDNSQTVAVSETGFAGNFVVSPSPTTVVSASIVGHTITVSPVGFGTGTVNVSDGTNSVNVGVTVVGPLSATPAAMAFAGPTSAPQTSAITDPNFGGSYTIQNIQPGSVVTAMLSGGTLTVTPQNAGAASVTITDGVQTIQVQAVVSPPPTISVVQSSRCYGSSAVVTCSIATPVPGDKIDALCAGNPTGSSPAGLTLLQFNVNPTNNNYAAWSVAVGSGTQITSYAFPNTAGSATGCEVVELMGVDPTLTTQVYGGDATYTSGTTVMNGVAAPYPAHGYVLGAFSPALTAAYTPGSATVTDGFSVDAEATYAPAQTPAPIAMTHVLVDWNYSASGQSAIGLATAAPYVSWAGPGSSAAVDAGIKSYNYTDPNEAYVHDNGPAYHDVCWLSATGGRAGQTDSGANCLSNGTNNGALALNGPVYVGGGSCTGTGNMSDTCRFASDPTQTTPYKAHVAYLSLQTTCYCGSDFPGTAPTATFFDDTGAQSNNAIPTGFSNSAWNTAYTSAYQAAGVPFLFNGLVSAAAANYSYTTNSSGSDSGGGSPLFGNGNGWDTSYILTNSPNSIGAMWEGCYGGNGYDLGNHSWGVAQDWGDMENYELWMAANSKIMWCRSVDGVAASSTQGLADRLYQYASFLLTYNPTYSMWGTSFTTSTLAVMPETQFVPTQPVISAPSLVSSLMIGSNCSASSPNCPFGRTYNACFYGGTYVGACAIAVNPTASTVTNPYQTGYAHSVVLAGSGVLDGGTVAFTGSIPTTLAADTAVIEIATAPTGFGSDFLWSHKIEGGTAGNTAETATFPGMTLATGPQTYVALVETLTGGTQPTPPPAGPVSVNPTSLAFANNLATPAPVTIMDPYFVGQFTATPPPGGLVTTQVNQNILTVSPNSVGNNGGSGTITISDGTNSTPLPFTVSPTPTPAIAPTPIATYLMPYSSLQAVPNTTPAAVTFPTPPALTIVAQIKTGPATVSNGAQIAQLPGSWSFNGGNFSGTTNCGLGTCAHMYTSAGQQSSPTNDLSTSTQYIVFGSLNGSTVDWTQCTYPSVSCTDAGSVSTSGAIPYSTAAGFIGAATGTSPYTRLFSGDIWNVQFFNTVLSFTQESMYAASSAMVADPYPSPVAAAYTNATPYGYPTPSVKSVTFPTSTTLTVAATVNCSASTNSSGSTIASLNGSWKLGAGLCNASTNPNTSNGLQAYDYANNKGAYPANGLASYPSGATFIAAVYQGSSGNVQIYVCPQAASPAWTCNAPVSVAENGNLALGTNPGYIGASTDGSSLPMQGDIWDFKLYTSALSQPQIQAIATSSRVDPYPTPTPAPGTAPTNYPSVVVASQWTNAAAITQVVAYPQIANNIKSFDSQATAFYSCWGDGTATIMAGTTTQCTSFSTSQANLGNWAGDGTLRVSYSGRDSGVYYTQGTAAFQICWPYNGTVSATSQSGCTHAHYYRFPSQNCIAYCGNSWDIDNIIIPDGASTQNSYANNCDCHLALLMPIGWVPHGINNEFWPTLTSPAQYSVEFENVGLSNSSCNAGNIETNQACKVFNSTATSGGSGAQPLYAYNMAITSTNGSAFTGNAGTTSQGIYIADGFSGTQGNQATPNPWNGASTTMTGTVNQYCSGASSGATCTQNGPGGAVHAGWAANAFSITANDINQGAILHAMNLGIICAANTTGSSTIGTVSDNWPALGVGGAGVTDTPCVPTGGYYSGSNTGGYSSKTAAAAASQGWSYGGHIFLRPGNQTCTTMATCHAAICANSSGAAVPLPITSSSAPCSSGDAVSSGFNTPLQVMMVYAATDYGFIITDTAGYGSTGQTPTFTGLDDSGNPLWQTVGQNYGLAAITLPSNAGTLPGYQANLGIPFAYAITRLHEVNSCIIPGAPDYNASRPTSGSGTGANAPRCQNGN